MPRFARTALVFPPLWYYASVPGDLLETGSALRAAGVPVEAFDLSSGLTQFLLESNAGYRALRDPDTYADGAAYELASRAVADACAAIGFAHGVKLDFYQLDLGADEEHLPTALHVGLDPASNPALPFYETIALPAILGGDPELVCVALVHPDQIAQVPVLGRLLRRAGWKGRLVLYGAQEDVLAPEDLLDDLAGDPPHALFDDFDAVVVGEAETPLIELARAVGEGGDLSTVPGLLTPGGAPPKTVAEDLSKLPPLDWSLVDATLYPFPAPVVDLRLSRSCPWGRCAFCAITGHAAGYRARPVEVIARDMAAAHAALGTVFFRLRDDLITPEQLGELARALRGQPFRWSARARFENGFSRELLEAAATAGLEELWLGLESAVPRVRNLMVKGVAQGVVERLLVDAEEAGIRVRALCMVGFPGETALEARATFDFLERHIFRLASVALTPFQLMRNTPLGRGGALRLLPDARPRRERLRSKVAFQQDLPVGALMREGTKQLAGWLRPDAGGPSLAHAWMRASAARRPFTR